MDSITIDFALPELTAKDRAQLERLAVLEAAETKAAGARVVEKRAVSQETPSPPAKKASGPDGDAQTGQDGAKDDAGADVPTSGDDGEETPPRWRREILASISPVQVLRLTVRKANVMDRMHYYNAWREGDEWYTQATGLAPDEVAPEGEAAFLRPFTRRRAEILAALTRKGDGGVTVYVCERVFVPYAHLLAYESDPEIPLVPADAVWEEAYLPPEWTALGATEPAGAGGMATEMPVELFDLLQDATGKLNRGVLPTVSAFFDPTRPLWSVKASG